MSLDRSCKSKARIPGPVRPSQLPAARGAYGCITRCPFFPREAEQGYVAIVRERDTARAMSQENVDVVRRFFTAFEPFGGRVERDEVADRMPDAFLGEFLDPELEWVPIPQGLLA